MVKRYLGMVVLVAVLLVGGMAGGALAVDFGDNYREFSEIRENAGEIGQEYLPGEFEIAGFFDWFIYPLIGIGVLMTAFILVRYLVNQPRFEREAEEKARR